MLAIDPLHHILAKATDKGKLHHLRGGPIRAALYADDADIFVQGGQNREKIAKNIAKKETNK